VAPVSEKVFQIYRRIRNRPEAGEPSLEKVYGPALEQNAAADLLMI
jgi:hypothetical protein